MWELAFGLAVAVNRATEAIKKTLAANFPDMPPQQQSLIVYASSLVIGVLFTVLAQINVFVNIPYYGERIPELVGTIITGFAVGLGADWLFQLQALVLGFRQRVTPSEDAEVSELVVDDNVINEIAAQVVVKLNLK